MSFIKSIQYLVASIELCTTIPLATKLCVSFTSRLYTSSLPIFFIPVGCAIITFCFFAIFVA